MELNRIQDVRQTRVIRFIASKQAAPHSKHKKSRYYRKPANRHRQFWKRIVLLFILPSFQIIRRLVFLNT